MMTDEGRAMDYFKQSALDGKVFLEHFERYGLTGMVTALKNAVNVKPDRRRCTNKCSVNFNQNWALNALERELRQIEKDALPLN